MPTNRRKRTRGRTGRAIDSDVGLGFLIGDGQLTFTSRTLTAAEAEERWPAYRRWCWLRCSRLSSPGGAAAYDGITLRAADTVRFLAEQIWNPARAPEVEAEVLATIAGDRAQLDDFAAEQPTAATELADVITLVRGDLDQLERVFLPSLLALAGDKDWGFRGAFYKWSPTPTGQRYGEALKLITPDEE